MRYLTFLAAGLALASCADSEEVPDDPAARETADAIVEPVPAALEDSWSFRSDEQIAVFGPPESEGIITLRCQTNLMNSRGLVFTWHVPASTQQTEAVRMESGDEIARFNAIGVESELGPGAVWQGDLAPDGPQASFLAQATEPIRIVMGGADGREITLPPSPALEQVVAACR